MRPAHRSVGSTRIFGVPECPDFGVPEDARSLDNSTNDIMGDETMTPTSDQRRPDRRHEVFISSTFEDLRDIREALIRETVICGHIPEVMEHFTAETISDQDFIRSRIAKADIFVILIGSRYGSEVRAASGSYTRLEYETAIALNKPILAFVLNEEEYHSARSVIGEGDAERSRDPDLRQFRNEVLRHQDGEGRIVKFFSLRADRRDDLIDAYQRAIANTVASLTSGGWVRGALYDDLAQRVSFDPVSSRNPFFRKFAPLLGSFQTLHRRCADGQPMKEALAAAFLDLYLGRIALCCDKLFFESGATLVYLFQELERRVTQEWMQTRSSQIKLETNNVLVYMAGIFSRFGRTDLYPRGLPDPKYGATFGGLKDIPEIPPYITGNMARIETPETDIITHFRGLYLRGLILMTTTGFDTTGDYKGPHVGSFHNALFKRALLTSNVPTVLLLEETKLRRAFDQRKCYRICEMQRSWLDLCSSSPLAVATACQDPTFATEITAWLRGCGLTFEEHPAESGFYPCTVVSNAQFQAALDPISTQKPQPMANV